MIQYTWSINNLPSAILVVSVSYEQTLSGECIWLHIHIGIGDIVHEAGFTDIRVASYYECSGSRINLRESCQMLSDLFQVTQRRL